MRRFTLAFVFVSLLLPAVVRAESFTEDLSLGSQGPEVSFLAEVLAQLPGTYDPDVTINDVFGPQDQTAVTRFQYSYLGIRDPDVLGRVEETTRAGLNALITVEPAADFNARAQAALDAYRLTQSAAALGNLHDALGARHESMETLCTVNPPKARQRFLSKAFRKRLPRHLRYMVEEENVSVKGTVIVTIEEQRVPPYAVEQRRFLLGKKGVAYRLPRDFQAVTGTKLAVRGTRMGDDLFPGSGPKDVRTVGHPPTFPVTPAAAEENLAAILLEFPDVRHNETPQAVSAAMNEIASYFAKASYGQTQVTIQLPLVWHMATKRWGRVAGETNDAAGLGCDRWAVLAEAMAAAAQEIDWSKVTVIMPVLVGTPTVPTCNPGQSGAGGAVLGRIGIKTPDGVTRTVGTSIVNDGIVTFADKPHTQIHEFTHTFGIGHTALIRCSGGTLSANVRGCDVGNSASDVMGVGSPAPTGWGIGDLNAEAKHQLGWHTSLYPAQEVTSPGTYQLSVSGRTSPGVKALVLSRNPSEDLWIEYRRPEGNDVPIGNATPLQTGMRIAARLPSLDPMYGSQVYVVPPFPFVGPSEGAAVGRTWYDPISKWAITPTAMTTDNLTVQITKVPKPVQCVPRHQVKAIGQSVTFSAVDGTDPVVWRNIGGPPLSATGRTLTTVFNSAGTFTVEARSEGFSLTDRCTVDIAALPVGHLTVDGAQQTTIGPNGSVALAWSSTNATDGCHLCYMPNDGAFCDETISTSGSKVDTGISDPRRYLLQCFVPSYVDWDWRTVHTRSEVTATTPEGNNAECVSIEVLPNPMQHRDDHTFVHLGEVKTVLVNFLNTGTTTWRADETPHRAMNVAAHAGINWDVTVAPLRRVTLPGEVASFSVDIRYIGTTYGDRPLTWQMSENGVPFGQACRGLTRTMSSEETPNFWEPLG